jgi:hypothetical protein
MANDYSWVIKGVVAGAIAGITIWALMGVYDIISMIMSSGYISIYFLLSAVVSYAFSIGYILAGAMSGFITVLLMSRGKSTKRMFPAVVVAGIAAGIISFFYPEGPGATVLPGQFVLSFSGYLVEPYSGIHYSDVILAGRRRARSCFPQKA